MDSSYDRMAVALLAGVLLPSELGMEVGVDSHRAGARVTWANQLGLCGDPFFAFDCPFHFVFSPELVIGRFADPGSQDQSSVLLRLRLGARVGLGETVRPFVGLGSTLEAWPDFRPSLSPELGVRWGRELGVYLVMRLDAWSTGPEPLRASASIGWSFF